MDMFKVKHPTRKNRKMIVSKEMDPSGHIEINDEGYICDGNKAAALIPKDIADALAVSGFIIEPVNDVDLDDEKAKQKATAEEEAGRQLREKQEAEAKAKQDAAAEASQQEVPLEKQTIAQLRETAEQHKIEIPQTINRRDDIYDYVLEALKTAQ